MNQTEIEQKQQVHPKALFSPSDPTHLMVSRLGPVILLTCFAFSLHLSRSPAREWGVLKGWEALVQGDQRSLKSKVTLSVFFLLHAFPSAMAVHLPRGPTVDAGTEIM